MTRTRKVQGKATKPDRTRQAVNLLEVTPAMELAIDLWLTGATDQEVADAVKKTRQTVNGWKRCHPAVKAELNRRRKELFASYADTIRAMVPEALAAVRKSIAKGNPQTALGFLSKVGLDELGKLEAAGPDTPVDVVDQEVRCRRPNPMARLFPGLEESVTDEERLEVCALLEAELA
jgi:hypothetical protein